MFADSEILLLADFDLTTLIALLVFGLLSGLGNLIKKRHGAKDTEEPDANLLEPVEVLDEPPPVAKRIRRPPAPAPLAEARPFRGVGKEQRGAQVPPFIRLIRGTPRPFIKEKAPPRRPSRRPQVPAASGTTPASLAPPVVPAVGATLGVTGFAAGLEDRIALRRAIVMAEILGPPVALREESPAPLGAVP